MRPHTPAHTADSADARPHAPPDGLTVPELVALQLLARGYSPDQIAALRGVALVDVLWDLQDALMVLRARTVRDAIAEAKRCGLID